MADSQEAMFARFSNPDLDGRIQTEMEGNIYRRGGPDTLLVTGESEWRGKTLEEISQEMETAPYAAAIEVVRSGNPSIASFNMTLDDISAIGIQSLGDDQLGRRDGPPTEICDLSESVSRFCR